VKECKRCKRLLPKDSFAKQAKRHDGLYPMCQECSTISRREWYLKTRPDRLKYRKQYSEKNKSKIIHLNKINGEKRQARVDQRKVDAGGKCAECGYDKYLGALHFHHINRTDKTARVSNKARAVILSSETAAELSKCVLLCANCHAEVHGRERLLCKNIKTGFASN